MNLIEALKKANGKRITREIYREECATHFVDSSPTARLHWVGYPNDPLPTDHVLADDWYVVEPKSQIEEAIEREAKRAVALNDVNGEAACCRVSDAMRRIVNLTLDEAKRVLTTDTQHKDYTIVINKRIDALKVKE